MNEPKWLSREDIESIHDMMLEIGGGMPGLRDAAMLESALSRPQNLYAYEEPTIFDLAASYAEIGRHQSFVDGNKRTGFGAAEVFLADNGYELEVAQYHEHADMMEQLGEGLITREDASVYFAEHAREIVPEQMLEPSGRDDLLKDYNEQPTQDEHENSRDHDMADDD